jgi:hypothetical protein
MATARVLWTYYRFVKGREGAPAAASSTVVASKSAPKKKPLPKRGRNGRSA